MANDEEISGSVVWTVSKGCDALKRFCLMVKPIAFFLSLMEEHSIRIPLKHIILQLENSSSI